MKYSTVAAAVLVCAGTTWAQPPGGKGPGGGMPGFAPSRGGERGGPQGGFPMSQGRFASPGAGSFPGAPVQNYYRGSGAMPSAPGARSSGRSSGMPYQAMPYGTPESPAAYGYPGGYIREGGSRSAPGMSYPRTSAYPGSEGEARSPSRTSRRTAEGYPASPSSSGSRSAGKRTGRSGDSPADSTWQPASAQPFRQSGVRAAEGGYSMPGQSPSQLQKQMKSSSNSLRAAMAQGDSQQIGSDLSGIRREASTLRNRLHTLPLEQRLHVPSIALMYDEGARLVEEGMQTNQGPKIDMGLEKIEEANKRLGELEKR